MLLSQKLKVVFDYAMITIGSLISALGLGVFLVEAHVVPGGVTGISMAINFVWDGLSVGMLILLLNIPLFLWGIAELGSTFGARTAYGFITNALFIDLFRGELFKGDLFGGELPIFHGWDLQNSAAIQYMLKNDFFFFMAIGTFLVGFGLGIIFKFKGTTAGTEIVCAIFKKRFGIKPGVSMLAVDLVVITMATVVLFLEPKGEIPVLVLAFYAVASLYFQSMILDRVVYGFDYAKNMMIFSSKNKEISNYIMQKLDRGVTAFYARGLYTDKDREVLMTIVSPNDARALAPFIRELDPNAFITLSDVHEVLGEGFRSREEVDIKFIKNMEKREAEERAAQAAKDAIRAEIAAGEASKIAHEAREIANQSVSVSADNHAKVAERHAEEARTAADKAREHAIAMENAASSIEECITLDDKNDKDKGDK
ncbi:MAG: YitT family protein [Proteobacteria bacterium]|nr:YitT family protein [Pseudomonadota bacterium]